MSDAINPFPLAEQALPTLEWCWVNLYPLKPNSADSTHQLGLPDVDNPVFIGQAKADQIVLDGRMNEVVQRPSGVQLPQAHHLDWEHTIDIRSIWILNSNITAYVSDFGLDRGNTNMFLWLYWTDELKSGEDKTTVFYYGRLYFMVNAPACRLQSEAFASFTADKIIRAKWYQEFSGQGEVPSVADLVVSYPQ